ncbi:hypothetical protein VNO80_25947 [Phaseolus coccineus]|uniref:Uncharacterized protein n=1 Tax=Phaseolus coccineus TaxID=3886 RepID=A0AAN9LVK5_PHACN
MRWVQGSDAAPTFLLECSAGLRLRVDRLFLVQGAVQAGAAVGVLEWCLRRWSWSLQDVGGCSRFRVEICFVNNREVGGMKVMEQFFDSLVGVVTALSWLAHSELSVGGTCVKA